MSTGIHQFIYCDENGNTGEHLLDFDQPLFVLASNDYSRAEAEDLVRPLLSQGASEAKFKILKKTPGGRARLIRLLVDPRLNSSRIAAFAIHKRYMVFTKLVDMVMETLLHMQGVDLYRNGANLATANMMYYVIPVYCGETATNAMLEAFIQLIRYRKREQVQRYVEVGSDLVKSCRDSETKDFLRLFFNEALMPHWLQGQPDNALDPAIPSLFKLIDTWGRRKTARFQVVHDRSKPIIASEATFKNMMAEANELSTAVGYDRRKFLFPLRADGLQHEDSTKYPQLQIADVCAGAIAHYLRCRLNGESDEICDALDASKGLEWVVGGVVPHPAVTPEDMDIHDTSGSNPVDSFVERLKRS
jgi:hypothetical protein